MTGDKLGHTPHVLLGSADVRVGHDPVGGEVVGQDVGRHVERQSSHVQPPLPHLDLVHLVQEVYPVGLSLGVILLKILRSLPVLVLEPSINR